VDNFCVVITQIIAQSFTQTVFEVQTVFERSYYKFLMFKFNILGQSLITCSAVSFSFTHEDKQARFSAGSHISLTHGAKLEINEK